MPLYRAGSELLYFVHVPKCAGTSVTEYLQARFGPAAFEDRDFLRVPASHPWSRTSPQHIDANSLERILPRSFFDHAVAFVRHPERRLASAYVFQRKQKTIGRLTSFDRWLKTLAQRRARNPYIHDNHPRPMCEFLPEDTTWFRMEEGFEGFITHLNSLFGPAPQALEIGHEKAAKTTVAVSERARELIQTLYAEDYRRFGYEAQP